MAKLVKFFEGSAALVGEVLGVGATTVLRWLKQGVPATQAGKPSRYVPRVLDLLATVEKSQQEEATFLELLKLAGELAEFPNIPSSDGDRSGKLTEGYQWTRRIQRRLSVDVVVEMAKWAMGRRGKWPIWMIVVMTSQYSLTPRHGFGAQSRADNYKTVQVQFGHVKAGDFAVERPEPTDLHDSVSAATEQMVSLFEEMLDDRELMVFVHAVTVYNWRKRSPQEIRDIASAERQARSKSRRRKKR